MVRKNITYHNPINQEENTPLVTILETKIDTKQSTAIDSRQAAYVIDLTKASFGGVQYPIPGSQWFLKKISGVWTLMARAGRQNPQLDPSLTPAAGDSYIGGEGTTYIVGDLQVLGTSPGGAPVGVVLPYAGSSSPTGWALCDGSALNRTTDASLFAIIGTTYGVGDGVNTFNVPDMRGNVAVGLHASQTEFDTLGETGGSRTHTLVSGEMPSHNHTQNSHTHTQDTHNHTQNSHTHTQDTHNHTQDTHNHTQNAHDHTFVTDGNLVVTNSSERVLPSAGTGGRMISTMAAVDNNTTTATNNTVVATNQTTVATNQSTTPTNQTTVATNQSTTATNTSTGGGGAHNNLQPYLVMNYIIKR